MMQIRTRMFVTALDILVQRATDSREKVNNELQDEPADDLLLDGDDMAAFDEALEVVLAARNEYCTESEMSIEDGTIKWSLSRIQQAEQGEGGGKQP